MRKLHAGTPSHLNREVPIWLDHIVLKAVARDKRQRFETAQELLLVYWLLFLPK